MHAFRRLLLTQLRSRRSMIMVILAADLILNAASAILTFRLRYEPGELSYIMSLNIAVLATMLLIPFMHCFSAWLDEWKQRSIYQLLSLPVPRVYLLASKSIPIMVEILLIIAVTATGLWIQHRLSGGLLFRAEPLISFDWSKVRFIAELFLVTASVIFLSSLSVFVGKWSSRLPVLVTFLTFIAGLFTGIIAFANFPSFFTLLIICVVYFWAAYYLLEKRMAV